MTNLVPLTVPDALAVAKELAASGMVPRDYAGKPGAIYAAIDLGASVGLRPMQAVQGIANINGRPALWGDAALGVVMAHPSFVSIDEDDAATAIKQGFGRCKVVRKGCPAYEVRFTVDMAKAAGLWGKPGPWTQYGGRMLQMRARSWAFRDRFPDALKGIAVAEEAQDVPPVAAEVVDMMPREVGQEGPAADDVRFETAADPVAPTVTPSVVTSEKIPADADRVRVTIKACVVKSGETSGRKWTSYRFTLEGADGPFEATTFSDTVGPELNNAVGMEGIAILTQTPRGAKLWGMEPC